MTWWDTRKDLSAADGSTLRIMRKKETSCKWPLEMRGTGHRNCPRVCSRHFTDITNDAIHDEGEQPAFVWLAVNEAVFPWNVTTISAKLLSRLWARMCACARARICVSVCVCVSCIFLPLGKPGNARMSQRLLLPSISPISQLHKSARHAKCCHFQQKLFAEKKAERSNKFRSPSLYNRSSESRLDETSLLGAAETFGGFLPPHISRHHAASPFHLPLSVYHRITYQSSSFDKVTLLKASEHRTRKKRH